MSGFADIADDHWGDKPHEYVVGWLIIVGTEEDEGRYILKTMICDTKGKLRQQEKELSQDVTMPNYVHKDTWEKMQGLLAILSIANINDPVVGIGQKIADDVYWIEGGYEKTLNNG